MISQKEQAELDHIAKRMGVTFTVFGTRGCPGWKALIPHEAKESFPGYPYELILHKYQGTWACFLDRRGLGTERQSDPDTEESSPMVAFTGMLQRARKAAAELNSCLDTLGKAILGD